MAGQSLPGGTPWHGHIPRPTWKAGAELGGKDRLMSRVAKGAEYAGAAAGLYSALRGAWPVIGPVLQGARAAIM